MTEGMNPGLSRHWTRSNKGQRSLRDGKQGDLLSIPAGELHWEANEAETGEL